MKVFDLSLSVPADHRQAIVAIGNFDAVHRGHQALLDVTRTQAQAASVPSAVLTFEPHPRRVFRPDDPPFRVTPLDVKLEQFERNGIDQVYVCPFNWELAGLSPEDFLTRVLKNKIDPVAVVVGYDFHFGHNRAGTPDYMRQFGLTVTSVPLLPDNQHAVISASRIRGALQAGHMDEVNALLGWDWIIRGVVGHGDKRGREIGYPTANVPLGETIHPSYGVYATWVQIDGETQWRPAATNIGIRPMFAAQTGLVEAHLLDFAGDLYGQTLHIRPVQKIRDEMKFSSLPELIAQIDKDCVVTRHILAAKP